MIGVLGGTFDPVHYGHIKPALAVKQELSLTRLLFIPNRIPPHREAPWLSVEQRLSLLESALDAYPDVIIDRRELDREGASYMVDTLASLTEDFPDEPLVLIVGMDVLFTINSWYQWKKLFELCHLVVTARPGFKVEDLEAKIDEEDYRFLAGRVTTDPEQLNFKATGKILLKSVPQLDISATQIRSRLVAGEDASEWMPEQAYSKLRGYVDDDR
jgi:nicotinate-nucleotide adenylyltransferase